MNDLNFVKSNDELYYIPTFILNESLLVFGEYINDSG